MYFSFPSQSYTMTENLESPSLLLNSLSTSLSICLTLSQTPTWALDHGFHLSFACPNLCTVCWLCIFFCIFYLLILQVRAVSLLLSMQCLAPSGPTLSSCENLLIKLQYNFWKAKLLLCVKRWNTAKYPFGICFFLFFSKLTMHALWVCFSVMIILLWQNEGSKTRCRTFPQNPPSLVSPYPAGSAQHQKG